jgi:hypothetical protein
MMRFMLEPEGTESGITASFLAPEAAADPSRKTFTGL